MVLEDSCFHVLDMGTSAAQDSLISITTMDKSQVILALIRAFGSDPMVQHQNNRNNHSSALLEHFLIKLNITKFLRPLQRWNN